MHRYLAVLCVMLLSVISPAHAAKPGSPITVEVVPLSTVKQGQEIRFKVTVVTQIPVEQLLVNIHPLGGAKWSKGEQHWRGKASAGVPVVNEFSIVTPKSGNFEIHAIASVQGKEGGGFGARTIYSYQDSSLKKPEPKEQKSLRHGKDVIEVPMK